jgi:hypothetical protein
VFLNDSAEKKNDLNAIDKLNGAAYVLKVIYNVVYAHKSSRFKFYFFFALSRTSSFIVVIDGTNFMM